MIDHTGHVVRGAGSPAGRKDERPRWLASEVKVRMLTDEERAALDEKYGKPRGKIHRITRIIPPGDKATQMKIVDMLRNDMPVRVIAEKLRISVSMVYYRKKKWEIEQTKIKRCLYGKNECI